MPRSFFAYSLVKAYHFPMGRIKQTYLGFAFTLFVPIFFFWLRRHYLGDPLVDLGSDLYLPWQILQGKKLYVDYFYLYGPLPVYLVAAVMACAGATWATLVAINFSFFLGILAILFFFLRRLIGIFFATAGGIFVSLFFGFNQLNYAGNYNFLTPYRSSVVQGLFFALLSLFFLQQSPRRRHFALAGICAGLCFLCKPEVFLALGGALALFFALRPERAALGAFLSGALCALSTAMAGLFVAGIPLRNLVAPYLVATRTELYQLEFYHEMWGWGEGTIALFAAAILGMVGLVVIPAVTLYALSHRGKKNAATFSVVWFLAFALGLGALLGLSEGLFPHLRQWLLLSPFLAASAAIYCVFRRWGSGQKSWAFLAACLAFAALLTVRRLFQATNLHYGFTLSLPAGLAVFLLVLALPRRWKAGREQTWAWRAWVIGLAVLQVWYFQAWTASFLREKTNLVKNEAVYFYWYPKEGDLLKALGGYLKNRHNRAASLTILPEGSFFNFLLRKPTPLFAMSGLPDQYLLFKPEGMIAQLEKNPADVLVVYPRVLNEFGTGDFTTGYGKSTYEWIRKNYRADPNLPSDFTKYGIEVFLRPGYQTW